MEIYIKNGEKRDGPFSIEALQGMLNEGKLSRTSLAIHEGLSNWIPLAAILTPRTGPPPYRPKGATTTVGTTSHLAPVAPPLIPGQSERQSGTGRRYYYILEEKQQGPVSEPDFRHIFDSGALPMTTPVWSDGMEGWEPAAVVMSSVPKVTEQPISMKRGSVEEPVLKALPIVGPKGRFDWRKLASVLSSVALLVILVCWVVCWAIDSRWTNTLGMEFVKVPNTEVMFSIWDTRVKDFRNYAEASSGVDASWKDPSFEQTDDHPVVNVSWKDARAFCAWLTKKERGERRIKGSQRYRLPTDAEWSVAVGLKGEVGGTPKDKNSKIKGVYPWGTQWPPPKGAGNYNKSLGVDDYDYTSPVGSFKANKHGLYDMGGNVWQWCQDWYDGDQIFRVLRGASWRNFGPGGLLSSGRNGDFPDYRNYSVGFRCVLVDDAQGKTASDAITEPANKPVVAETVPSPDSFTAGQRWTNTVGMVFTGVAGVPAFSIWDTRVSDYRAYAKANSGIDQSWKEARFEQTADHPVVNVCWDDAQAFCAWLTKKERGEGKIKADQRYRLPTDAEWSVAVGLEGEAGGTPEDKNMKIKGVYPWGTQWPPPEGAGNYAPSLGVDDYVETSPVGSFAPNKHGLYDMGGNVWQWCEDWYDGAQTSRVLRGASWIGGLLSSFRFSYIPGSRIIDVGFRCVLVGESGPVVTDVVPAPASFTVGQRWTNTMGMEFVTVPGTEVMFSIWDTRVRDYRSYDGAGRGGYGTWKEPGFEQTADHPVVKVSWDDAQAFCAWLTKKERGEGKIKADQRYRLPTDAEWSVAVGLKGEVGVSPKDKEMKIEGVYPWGTQWPPPKGAGNYNPSLGVDDYNNTSPVGSFNPNKHGLYDMGGNVWQWCEDWYDGEQKYRVLRGASWYYGLYPGYLLSSNRGGSNPDNRSNDIGFRCVLVGGGSL